MYRYSKNIVTVNTAALRHNYRLLQNVIGEEQTLLAMVKADAYGHGMIDTANALQEVGCHTFGVAEMGEGIRLREHGIEGDILLFVGFEIEHRELLWQHRLTPVVFLEEDLIRLSETGERLGEVLNVFLKVDTGMRRLGVPPKEVGYFKELIEKLPGINLSGLVSHLARADEQNSAATLNALAEFKNAVEEHSLTGLPNHIANSGGILNYAASHLTFSRVGISLYGYYPDGGDSEEVFANQRLLPAMTFTTRVLQVKDIEAGDGISYGHTFVAEKKMKVAVLPVGYEDGFARVLSNRGEVLVNGKRAKVCGRVCMNVCIVDITGNEGVKPGDEVVIMGTQGEETITANDIAQWCGTISHEVLCMIGNNNKRVHI